MTTPAKPTMNDEHRKFVNRGFGEIARLAIAGKHSDGDAAHLAKLAGEAENTARMLRELLEGMASQAAKNGL